MALISAVTEGTHKNLDRANQSGIATQQYMAQLAQIQASKENAALAADTSTANAESQAASFDRLNESKERMQSERIGAQEREKEINRIVIEQQAEEAKELGISKQKAKVAWLGAKASNQKEKKEAYEKIIVKQRDADARMVANVAASNSFREGKGAESMATFMNGLKDQWTLHQEDDSRGKDVGAMLIQIGTAARTSASAQVADLHGEGNVFIKGMRVLWEGMKRSATGGVAPAFTHMPEHQAALADFVGEVIGGRAEEANDQFKDLMMEGVMSGFVEQIGAGLASPNVDQEELNDAVSDFVTAVGGIGDSVKGQEEGEIDPLVVADARDALARLKDLGISTSELLGMMSTLVAQRKDVDKEALNMGLWKNDLKIKGKRDGALRSISTHYAKEAEVRWAEQAEDFLSEERGVSHEDLSAAFVKTFELLEGWKDRGTVYNDRGMDTTAGMMKIMMVDPVVRAMLEEAGKGMKEGAFEEAAELRDERTEIAEEILRLEAELGDEQAHQLVRGAETEAEVERGYLDDITGILQ